MTNTLVVLKVLGFLLMGNVSTNIFRNFNFLTFFLQDFLSRVRLVQLTDSVHYGLTGHREVDRKLRRCSKNFVTSSLPPGTPVRLVPKGGEQLERYLAAAMI